MTPGSGTLIVQNPEASNHRTGNRDPGVRSAKAGVCGQGSWLDIDGNASRTLVPLRQPRVSGTLSGRVGAREIASELESLHPRCFGWALACCDWNADEAADVLQAVYLEILDGRARFESRSRLSTFVFGVVRRMAAQNRRRRIQRRLLLVRYLETGSGAGQEAADARMPGEVRRLRSALSALPARQREVLHLVFYAELSIREAAEVMGVSLGTARTHYERGKRRLRERLTPDTSGEEKR